MSILSNVKRALGVTKKRRASKKKAKRLPPRKKNGEFRKRK